MSRTTTARRLRFGLILYFLLAPRAAFTQPVLTWVPTDLGTLGGDTGYATGINAAGQVVGVSTTGSGSSTVTPGTSLNHAFIWTAVSGMVDLGTLGGTESFASAINDVGQVVGWSLTADGQDHAFLWTAAEGMIDLGPGFANDINNAGQIVGARPLEAGGSHAFLRTPSGSMVDLGTLGGNPWSEATAINEAGQVAGTSWGNYSLHAFLWNAADGMVDLGELGPGAVSDINNAAQMVGTFLRGNPLALIWTAASGWVDLGTLGGTWSHGNGINNAGQVVGSSTTTSGLTHAFLWAASTGMVDVSASGAGSRRSTAAAINDAAQIVGTGENNHPVLWELRDQEPVSVSQLTPSVAFPVVTGTLVTWTASATGGVPPYTFQYWVFDGAGWQLERDWDTSASWTWEAPLPGSYIVQVWVRSAGSSTEYDGWFSANATISAPSVLTITTVRPSTASVPAGTTLTWSAAAAGGTGPYTYTFFVYDGTTWTVGRDWSPASSWDWTPPTPGTYAFQVWVRNAGSTAIYDAWRAFGPYTATRPLSLTVTGLTPDPAMRASVYSLHGPVATPLQTPVAWTACAAGGSGPYTYKFFVFDGSLWSVGQDWSASNSWTWLPTTQGPHQVQVWVRNAGSTSPYDAWLGRVFTVVAPIDLRVDLTSDRTFPVPSGTPITWTAHGSGGTGPYTYKFLLFDGSTWSVGRNWSASANWTWIPSTPGSYFVQAWIRNAGSSNAYDAWSGTSPLAISSATAFPVVTLTTAPMSPLFVDEPATLSAGAVGGSGPYTYKFWVYDGSTWTVGQAWSASSTYAWSPLAAGTYWIQVWVRNAGSTSPYDAWSGLGPLTVLP